MRKGERGPRANAGPVEVGETVMIMHMDGDQHTAKVTDIYANGFKASGYAMAKSFMDIGKTWRKLYESEKRT